MAQLKLNAYRRKALLEAIHKSIFTAEPTQDFKNAVTAVYNFVKPYLDEKYPIEEMQVLSKYELAVQLGSQINNAFRVHSLAVDISDPRPDYNGKYTRFTIDYDLNGRLLPIVFMRKHHGCLIYWYGSSLEARIPKSYNHERLNLDLPGIVISEEITTLKSLHGTVLELRERPNIIYNQYQRLVETSRTFEFLLEVNPSLEKFRKICEDAEPFKKAPVTETKCRIHESQVKEMIQNPVNF